ncbi:MAG TPA: cardiolipin synthase [Candidatus Acidoferrales bacterium]|nr:cardiolipin synthase [Candidatus Acidoferrales bacterium]
MKQTAWWLALLLLVFGCAKVVQVYKIPDLRLGEGSFFPTIEAHTGAPIVGGNRIDILLNGDETFPAMLEGTRKAKASITFAQYLYEDGAIARQFAETFAERCRAGVPAHILLDSHGSGKAPAELIELMTQAGCQVEYFRRVEAPQVIFPWKLLRYNYRNHRRILVIDGRTGFTGGYGISAAWTGDGRTAEHWRETNVRVEGPVVQQLQAAFVESWLEATGTLLGGEAYFPRLEARGKAFAQVVKSSPVGGSFQNYMLFLLSISSARKSILISNPYFLPDDRIVEALASAAKRGVRVMVLVPAKIDHPITYRASRSGYGRLLRGGIEIYEYLPALLHAKTMVVDDVWATVGSTNIDNRSFALNEELNLTIHDRGLARRLEQVFYEDLKHSRKVTYEQWRSRGLLERFYELFAFPIREQL